MNVRLDHRAIRIPVVRNATQQWSVRETLLLQVGFEGSAIVGYGEASPLPGFSREAIADVSAWLQKLETLEIAVDDLDVSAWPSSLLSKANDVPASARFCVESALLTAFCAKHGLSLEQALSMRMGASPVAQRHTSSCEEYAALLDVFDEGVEQRVLDAARRGTRVFKVKIGRNLESETRTLTNIVNQAQAEGRAIRLRLDANQSLSLPLARRLAHSCEHLPIEYLEEPCSTSELLASQPQNPIGLPLAFDESLTSGAHALRPWLDSGQVHALVCKPMYLGGLCITEGWVRVAAEYGLTVVMSHLFDGPWAFRLYEAMAHVYAPGVVAGLAPHAALPVWREVLGALPSSEC